MPSKLFNREKNCYLLCKSSFHRRKKVDAFFLLCFCIALLKKAGGAFNTPIYPYIRFNTVRVKTNLSSGKNFKIASNIMNKK